MDFAGGPCLLCRKCRRLNMSIGRAIADIPGLHSLHVINYPGDLNLPGYPLAYVCTSSVAISFSSSGCWLFEPHDVRN